VELGTVEAGTKKELGTGNGELGTSASGNVYDIPTPLAVLDPDHQLRTKVVLLADVLEQLGPVLPLQIHPPAEGSGIGTGIVDRDLVAQRVERGPGKPFDGVELRRQVLPGL